MLLWRHNGVLYEVQRHGGYGYGAGQGECCVSGGLACTGHVAAVGQWGMCKACCAIGKPRPPRVRSFCLLMPGVVGVLHSGW